MIASSSTETSAKDDVTPKDPKLDLKTVAGDDTMCKMTSPLIQRHGFATPHQLEVAGLSPPLTVSAEIDTSYTPPKEMHFGGYTKTSKANIKH